MPATAPISHFQSLGRLSEKHRRAMQAISSPTQCYPANRTLLQANGPTSGVYLIVSGFACRYVTLRTGERQILSFMVPGDLCDVRLCFSETVDFFVETLSPVEATKLSHIGMLNLVGERAEIAHEVRRHAAIEDATARQWLLNLGRRNAIERLAHLLCECFTRLTAVGLTSCNDCYLPITQRHIADALALSQVHVNRTLMELRRMGLVILRGRRLFIPDLAGLHAAACFDPRYLQLEGANFKDASVRSLPIETEVPAAGAAIGSYGSVTDATDVVPHAQAESA